MDLELLTYRIISGKLKCSLTDRFGQNHNLFLLEPCIDDLFDAQFLYVNDLQDALKNEVFDELEYIEFLFHEKLWSDTEEQELEDLPNKIEDLKVELYDSFAKVNKRNVIRRELKELREKHQELFDKRHKYDYLSAHGVASMSKAYFLAATCARYQDNRVYQIRYNDSNLLLDKILEYKSQFRINEGQLREIARNDPWKSYWACGNPFGKPSTELSEDQRNLILISKMYDSVYESYECPHSSIVEDDDMLDGWLIKQRRKREAEQNRREGEEKIGSKVGKHDSIFIPIKEYDESMSEKEMYEGIKKVRDMNSPAAQMQKANRMNQLFNKGQMHEGEFADQKIKILNEMAKLQKGS